LFFFARRRRSPPQAAFFARGADVRHAFAGYGCSFASDAFNARVAAALGAERFLGDCAAWVAAATELLLRELRPGDVLATSIANWKFVFPSFLSVS